MAGLLDARSGLSRSVSDDDSSGVYVAYDAIEPETLPVRGSFITINTQNVSNAQQNEYNCTTFPCAL